MKLPISQSDPIFSPLQLEVDSLVSSFLDRATDWRSLAAVTAGGVTSRLGRLGVMSTETGAASRFFSVGVGLGTESSVFEATGRLLSDTGSNAHLWRWDGPGGVRQGLLSSLITFGSLKGAGRLAQGENVIVQHLFQDTSIVLGHRLSNILGIGQRPTGTLAEQFLSAEAMNLQLSAGLALVRHLSPGMDSLERGLEFSIRSKGSWEFPLPEGPMGKWLAHPIFESSPAFSLWSMSESKGEKGGPPSDSDIDKGWDDETPTPPWTDQEAAWFGKATAPSSSPKSIRAAEQTHQVLRAFLLMKKQDMREVEEAIEDYLTYCRTQGEEGKEELYAGIMEVRERARIFQTPKEKYQYLYTYTRLAENLDPKDIHFWKEFESLGGNITDPHLHSALLDVMVGTFVKLAESLWRDRPAVALELKDTFEVLKFIYRNEQLSSDSRGRAMGIYAEFRSFIEEE